MGRMSIAILGLVAVHLVSGCGKPSQTGPGHAFAANGRPAASLGEVVAVMSPEIRFIHQDVRGNHWFASPTEGVFKHDGKTLTRFTTAHGLVDNHVRRIQEDASGSLYFDTLSGVSRFDGVAFTTLKPVPGEWKLEPGDLWFRESPGAKGPCRYDGTTLHQLTFPDHPMERELAGQSPGSVVSPYEIYSIYQDRSGQVWFGTGSRGAFRYDGRTLSWLYENHLTNAPNGGSFGIRSFVEDSAGRFWICNSRHRFDLQPAVTGDREMERVRYRSEPGFEATRSVFGKVMYFQAAVATDGAIWLSSYRDGVWEYDGKTATRHAVEHEGREIAVIVINKDREGVLWLGTQEHGAYRWNGEAFVPARF